MRSRFVVAAALGAVLVGCSTAQIEAMDRAAGLGVVATEHAGFDGEARVTMSPAFVARGGPGDGVAWTAPFELGALWRAGAPNAIDLVVHLPEALASIRSLALNVDGAVQRYEHRGRTRFGAGSSTAYIAVPLDAFLGALEAEDVQGRVVLGGGTYVDGDLGARRGRGGALTATHHLEASFVPALREAAGAAR